MERYFDKELKAYRSLLMRMLLLTHQQSILAARSLCEFDLEKAKQVMRLEKQVDQLEVEISQEAMRFLSLRSPMMAELRLVFGGARMSSQFERIGDEAKKIAKRTRRMTSVLPPSFSTTWETMYETIDGMFHQLQVIFAEGLPQLAKDLKKTDARVDRLNRTAKKQVLEMIESGNLSAKTGFDLLNCTAALERIGDHTTNLAEIMVFQASGQDMRERNYKRK